MKSYDVDILQIAIDDVIKKTKLIDLIKPISEKIERGVNTNNAWGFGGAVKDIYHLKPLNKLGQKLTVHKGIATYRHLESQQFINLRANGIILHEGIKSIVEYLQTEKIL